MKHILRAAALFVTLCVLLCSMTSCLAFFRIANLLDDPFADPSDDPNTKPNTGNDGPITSSQYMKYTLSEAEERAFAEQLAACRRLTLDEGTDAVAIEAAWEQLEEQYYHISTQSQIAYILYCADQSDESLSDNYLYSSELSGRAYGDYMELCLAIYESTSPYRDTFFADWSEDEIAEMRSYSDELETYRQANDELLLEFRALGDGEFFDKAPELYLKSVKNLNTIAALQGGGDNYYTYAYDKIYLRDFDGVQLKQLRQYTATYLIPLQEQLYNAVVSRLERLPLKERRLIDNLLTKDYDKLSENYVDLYLQSLPSEMKSTMQQMFHSDNSLFVDGNDAYEGAFTGMLYEYERAFCYFGPSYQSTGTVIHELGHYYADRYVGTDNLSIDLAEVHSQGNEMLFLAFMKQHMDAETFEVFVDYQMYSAVTSIILCVVIDEFESRVYREADHITDPVRQLDAIMDDVLSSYGGVDYFAENIADAHNYWRLVTMESPVYYISYAVSGIVSIELYAKAVEDLNAACGVYERLISEFTPAESFSEALMRAGLHTPFDEGVFREIKYVLLGGR